MKITHPDGSVIELESEQDVLLYEQMYGNGRSAGAVPVAGAVVHDTLKPSSAVTARSRARVPKIIKEYASVLQAIKELEPEPVMRADIAELLNMEPPRVSECLAELKRLGLAINLPRPNTWKWQLTERARTVGWEVKA